MSYDCWKLDRFAESEFWADSTFRSKSGFWQNFVMTFPETLNTKVVVNELSSTLVTHKVYSDAQFDRYEILSSGRGAGNFLDRRDKPVNNQVLRAEDAWNLARVVNKFRRTLTQFPMPTHMHIFSNHINGYMHLNTTTCGVQRIAIKWNRKWFGFGHGFEQWWDYNF
jgi:hypothetical protein